VYEYNERGYVTRETTTGDVAYEIVYNYDENDNIISEDHYKDGDKIGEKIYIYHPQLGYITEVISTHADDVQLVYNDDTTQDLDNRVSSLENLDISNRLDDIEANMLIGPYDGATLKNTVDSFNARLESVEQFVGEPLEEIIDVPALVARVEALETAMTSGRKVEEFVVADGNKIFQLNSTITLGSQRVFVDGIYVAEGIANDYTINEDRDTITFITSLLNGSVVMVEYY
jgi:hypothetical protein